MPGRLHRFVIHFGIFGISRLDIDNRRRIDRIRLCMNIREIVGLSPVIPLLTINELAQAVPLARALVAGGLPVLEVTLRTPIALACIEAIRKELPQAVVGAGTLTRAVDFAGAGRAGALFGATPGLTPELAAAARGARFPLLPGVMTPSELITARHGGYNIVKFFPVDQAGGIGMLRALAAPFPEVLFCPAGGITRESASDYLSLTNVVCIGASWMVPPAMLAASDWSGIEMLARDAASIKS
jgi:2-dehydro-3-deoxyphosphogluconate aldolase / (4S)-4-hydroxy-2-oxoglutarate aldolase